jgi:hypothetical protein
MINRLLDTSTPQVRNGVILETFFSSGGSRGSRTCTFKIQFEDTDTEEIVVRWGGKNKDECQGIGQKNVPIVITVRDGFLKSQWISDYRI